MTKNIQRLLEKDITKSTPINNQHITSTNRTNDEALTILRQIQRELMRGMKDQDSKILLRDYLHEWLNTSRMALRPKTVDDYGRTIQKHIIPHLGDVPMIDLSVTKVETFYCQLIESGVGIRTVRLVHSILHRALERAVFQQLLLKNPTAKAILPRYIHDEMKVLDVIRVKQFLEAANERPYVALYHLAVKTGMRMGELLGLKWKDLQWGNGRLYVQRQLQDLRGYGYVFQEPKTRSGRRTIQLGKGTLDTLHKHFAQQQQQKVSVGHRWQDCNLIFSSKIGSPLDPSNLRLDFKHVIKRAGVPRVRFHDLRHTAASLLLNNGIPVIVVSRILRHSSPSITMDIYGHLYNEKQDEVAHLMDELVSPN